MFVSIARGFLFCASSTPCSGLISFHFAFGLESECILENTRKGIELKINQSNTRGTGSTCSQRDFHLLFPVPHRAWSSTTARMISGSRSRTRVPVLIIIVVALRLAAVSYDDRVSKAIVHFPATVVTHQNGSSRSSLLLGVGGDRRCRRVWQVVLAFHCANCSRCRADSMEHINTCSVPHPRALQWLSTTKSGESSTPLARLLLIVVALALRTGTMSSPTTKRMSKCTIIFVPPFLLAHRRSPRSSLMYMLFRRIIYGFGND